MEQLFAVRVLVHYHDKSNVDHAAVRRLLAAAAVDSLTLLLTDGTSLSLSTYIQITPTDRKPIADIIDSNGSALTQVASVFMLAEARAAADALPSSPHELETACSALERLLGCLATKRPQLPVRDIKQSARVKFGTAARRRAVHRLSRSPSTAHQVSILKAVNAILRLCDVATHCLAVVSRQSLSSKASCETAVALSTRLLTLAASLYEVQKVDTTPALSFFSSKSLRTALVAGAMHLGTIAVEHLEIEPMAWIHVANRIVMNSSTSAAPKTSVLSALFGGMIKACKRYEVSERDTKAAEGALCLLSTLHVVLETDFVRGSQSRVENTPNDSLPQSSNRRSSSGNANPVIVLGTGAISQAARSFLGERVVSAEEDGDEGRIAARTVYQACEEYAERAGEGDGIMGLLVRLFASAGRQSRLEGVDEPIVSISEGNLVMQPDESDASSDGSHLRPESPPFLIDVFDQRSKDGCGASATVGSTSEAGVDHAERVELHREIAALALDTLAHWVSRSEAFQRYSDLDITTFSLDICRSASFFSLGSTPASYDLRAAMVDFGSLLGPLLLHEVANVPPTERETRWSALVANLVSSCCRINPILKSILSCNNDVVVIKSLVHAFLEGYGEEEESSEQNPDTSGCLPVECLLNLLLSLITGNNALQVVEGLAYAIKELQEKDLYESSMSHRASCLTLLSHSVLVVLGDYHGVDTARIAFAALYHRDGDNLIDPIFPGHVPESKPVETLQVAPRCSREKRESLVELLRGVPESIDRFCFQKTCGSWEVLSNSAAASGDGLINRKDGSRNSRSEKLFYHMLWSCTMLHKALTVLSGVSQLTFHGLLPSSEEHHQLPLCSPFVCMKALESQTLNSSVMDKLSARKQGSLTLLYTAECLALTYPQQGSWKDGLGPFSRRDLPTLLVSIVQNVVTIASDCIYDDVASNVNALQRSFRQSFTLDVGEAAADEARPRAQFVEQLPRGQACLAFLQLGMTYMRSVGTNQLAHLLGSVMACAIRVLNRLDERQVADILHLMLDVGEILLFIPESFDLLAKSAFQFLKQLMSLAFPAKGKGIKSVEEAVLFIARVRGFGRIVRLGATTPAAIHLLCKFACDSSTDSTFDSLALDASISPGSIPDNFGIEVSRILKEASPTLSISEILSMLLVPEDESAVAVSTHARSLSSLTEACESSSNWHLAVLQGLNQLFSKSAEDFATRLVRRSVLQSATMHEGIVVFFDRVVGKGRDISSSRIIHKAFYAVQQLFETETDIGLEGKVRMLVFAARLSISDGRLSRKTDVVSPPLLGDGLFKMTVKLLERLTSSLKSSGNDHCAKQVVLFLCGFMDCFLMGIYGNRSSFFKDSSKQRSTMSRGAEEEMRSVEEDTDSLVTSGNEASEAVASSGDVGTSSLCTYTTTGSQFVMQHWYFCYTCELAGSEGVCSVCARICHSGCELAYSKFSRFFCDCGAGSDPQQENASNAMSTSEDGDGGNSNIHETHQQTLSGQSRRRNPCKCLRSSSLNDPPTSKLPSSEDEEATSVPPNSFHDVLGDPKLRDSLIAEIEALKGESQDSAQIGISPIQESFETIMKSSASVKSLIHTGLRLVRDLDNVYVNEEYENDLCDLEDLSKQTEKMSSSSSFLSYPEQSELASSTKIYTAGTLDMTGAHDACKTFFSESLIAFTHYRSVIAVGRKAGLIEFLDAIEMFGNSENAVEKTVVDNYEATSVSFDIVFLQFHPANENMLLVVGEKNVSVLSRVYQGGSWRWNRSDIELGLTEYEGSDGENNLRSTTWVDGETASVLVTTAKFVKVFDVANDIFSPRFFSVVPEHQFSKKVVSAGVEASNLKSDISSSREILAASLISRFTFPSRVQSSLVCILTTDGKVFVAQVEDEKARKPGFVCLMDIYGVLTNQFEASVVSMVYHPAESLLAVAFKDGSLLCVSLAISVGNGNVQASIRWMRLFREAVPSGFNVQLRAVPGSETIFIFCQQGQTLKASGVLMVSRNMSLKTHYFSGSPSASVTGVTVYGSSALFGKPSLRGGFLVLNDGSLHRIDVVTQPSRPQVSEQTILSNLVERRRIRALKSNHAPGDNQLGYSSLPNSVGFFEKCRLVSDHVAIETPGNDPDYVGMSVTLAGGGGECVVSPRENEPFKFVATVENQAIVLVGARLRFGGAESSRNRVPADVKVFGRMVRWRSKNNTKRWLDIPFTVPESTSSPQKVSFELFPRRSLGENRTLGDGYSAIDVLELYAVSNIEFTERKLVYENEKTKHYEALKKQRNSCNEDVYKSCSSNILPGKTTGDSAEFFKCTPEQAALLTVLNAIDNSKFAASDESALMLLEVNNLWSAVFKESDSRNPQFLEQLVKPCLSLCSEVRQGEHAPESIPCVGQIMAKAIDSSTASQVFSLRNEGVFMHVDSIERSLFAAGGIARSLLIAGCSAENLETGVWLQCYYEAMPSSSIILSLFSAYLNVGVYGRAQFKSFHRSSMNIVDIYAVFTLKQSLQGGTETVHDGHAENITEVLVNMFCSLDQCLRLFIGQRLLELCDSPVAAAESIGSPFESILAVSIGKRVKGPNSTDDASSSSTTDLDDPNRDANSSQRWAYRCDSCGKVCDQEWWHCNECEDFDLCTSCLRKPKMSFETPHKEEHMLLRGNAGDEESEQDDGDGTEKEVPAAVLSIQQVLEPIIDRLFYQMCTEEDVRLSWRFLDAIETIVQFVGKRSPMEFRPQRLKVLFDSSFTKALKTECEHFAVDLNSVVVDGRIWNDVPRSAISLFLMLRILLCSRGSTSPTHLHSSHVPSILFSLLEKMHAHLNHFVQVLAAGGPIKPRSSISTQNLVSWNIWNQSIPGISYDIIPGNATLKQSGEPSGLFQVDDELGDSGSIFMNILISSLDILEYSFKAAASASISGQIRELPRNILCDVIIFSESNTDPHFQDNPFFKDCGLSATRVLSALSFDDTDALNNTIDKHLYEEQSARLGQIVEEQDLSTEKVFDYDIVVEVASIMASLHKAAVRHPATWRRFVIENENMLQHVSKVARALNGHIRVHALQLLATGMAVSDSMASKVVKGSNLIDVDLQSTGAGAEMEAHENGNTATRERGQGLTDLVQETRENAQASLSLYGDGESQLFEHLAHEVMLKSQTKAARVAASHLLIFAILRAVVGDDELLIGSMHGTLMKGIDLMPFAGELADGFLDCLRFFIMCCQADLFGIQSEPLLTSIALSITSSLRHRCNLMISHPNARLYGRLSASLDIQGYFLESDPCMSCSASICESSERKECRLDTIRAETKYTDCSVMHRLVSTHELSAISVKVVDPRRSRRAKTIDILYSPKAVTDGADLKSVDHPWRKLKSLELGPSATEACVNLLVPVAAANIKLEFVEFHILSETSLPVRENQDAENAVGGNSRRSDSSPGVNENLQCPRCSRSVTDRHGICRNCHENAYQCRQCRNINYENLDGFLCNECGYCKHGRFEFSVTGRPTFVAERIVNEEDRKRASKTIERETGNVHRCMDQLTKLRSFMIRSLNSGVPTEEVREKNRLFSGRVGLADILDSVAPRSEIAVLEALLEHGQASQEIEEAANSTQGGISVTEEVIAESSGSADPSEREHNNPTGSGIASPVARGNRLEQTRISNNNFSNIISKSTTALATTYSKECRSIYATMSRGIRVLTLTRTELVRYANTVGGSRLQYASDIATEEASTDAEGDFASSFMHQDESKISASQKRVVCYGCTQSFISKCVKLVQTIMKRNGTSTSIIQKSNLAKDMMLVSSLCEKSDVQGSIRDLITCLVRDNLHATQLVCRELARKIEFCIDSFETVDSHSVARFEMAILEATATLDDNCWEERLKLVIRILFKSSKYALTCSSVSESIILPCLRVALPLMRVDSDLTVIESTSNAEGGSAIDAASNEALQVQASEYSETENDDLEATTQVAIQRNVRDGDLGVDDPSEVSTELSRRRENGDENVGLGSLGNGSLVAYAIGALFEVQQLGGARDNLRLDDRRPGTQRVGSDFMSGSGAPSSIGTAVDGQLSDDEVNVTSPRQGGIDMRAINNMLENDHESKLVSADVDRWLEGKFDQTSWIAGMKERSIECEQKEKISHHGDSATQVSCLKMFFQKWRIISNSSGALRQISTPERDQQYFKKLSIEKDNWIVRLMLFTPCTTVRKEACALLELICGQEETLQLQLLDVLTGPALYLGADAGEKSKEFFNLLEATLSSPSHRLYLIATGFLPRLASLIRTRAERLILSEANAESSLRLVNFLEGYSLKRLLSLLRQTLEAVPSRRASLREKLFKVDNHKLVWSLQRAYICVRKLISLRTRLTDDCGSQLCEVLLSKEFLFSGPTVTAVVSACVSELRAAKRRNDAQALAILLEQLCLMLCPERKEPVCFLSLNKAPTQDEFIRGSMSRNPYPSSAFDGPLMRDVKNKICKDLDLPGLLEDDFAMELLVAGNLVKLDLPIMAVYDHVWRGSTAASIVSSMQPTQLSRTFGLRRASHVGSRAAGGGSRLAAMRGTILTIRRANSDRDSFDEDSRIESRSDPPMVVVYRLSGLDGEATEPIVDSVPVESNVEQDAEELYGDTIIFGEVGGLGVLFELLTIVGSWGDDAETAVRAPALRLLRASCEVARNRTLLAKSPDAVRTLLDCAASAFEHSQGSPTAVISAESLLIAAEQILAQQRKELETHASTMPDTVSLSSQDPEEVISRIQVFLGRLSVATSPKAEHSILHLLPFLVQGVPGAIDIVLEYFHFSWDSIDNSDDALRKAKQLGTVLLATPHDLRGDKFAWRTIRAEVGRKSVEYIIGKFPVPKSGNKSQWVTALEYPGPPLVLRLITGLSLFLGSKQKQQVASDLLRSIFKEHAKIIPVLCQLEMAVSGNAIGTTTEELLEAMAKDPNIRREIETERESIKKARREAAKASRMNILREAGLASASSEPDQRQQEQETTSQASQPGEDSSLLELMQKLPDEVGPSCVVCGDGFRCRPEEALGFYVYCRKVPLDLSSGPHAAVGQKCLTDSGGSSIQGSSGHVELELLSSGRSRSQSGVSSRSGVNSCYATVTHLNAIHLSCHKEAARVDRTSRRDEWEGAFLRNSQTKCNNLFPVRPPVTCKKNVDDECAAVVKQARMSYSSAVDGYFTRLSSLGRTSLPHSKALTYDIGRSLLRFGDGGTAVFSEHAKGGGPHSNACLIPNMVGLALYMLQSAANGENESGNQSTDSKSVQTQEAALEKFLNEDEVGDITYYIASALVLHPLKAWKCCGIGFLRRGVRDGVLKREILLRLIAFTDLVNRRLKRGVVVEEGQQWLDGFRGHIGRNERFGQEFGDCVNQQWELRIRKVRDSESFVKALRENVKVCGDDGSESDVRDDEVYIEEMQECLKEKNGKDVGTS